MTENIINDSEEIFKLNRCSQSKFYLFVHCKYNPQQLFCGIEVLKFTDSSTINY